MVTQIVPSCVVTSEVMSLGGYRNYRATNILAIGSHEALSSEIQSGAAITHLKVSPNGHMAIIARVDSRIELFHRGTLAWTFSYETEDERQSPIDYVRALAFSHDESRLFVLAHDSVSCFLVNGNRKLWERTVDRINAFQITTPISCIPLVDGAVVAFENGNIMRLDVNGNTIWRIEEAYTPRWMRLIGDELIGIDGHNWCQWNQHTGERTVTKALPNRVYGYDRNQCGTAYRTADHIVWVNDAGESAQESVSIGLPSLLLTNIGVIAWGELDHLQLWWPELGRRVAVKVPSEILTIAQHPISQHLWLGLRNGTVMSTSLNIS